MNRDQLQLPSTKTILDRLINAPDLVDRVRALPEPNFAALVRRVGVADAGELVALATTDQIVAAFDEDLFVNEAPGEREVFDADRFVEWLEVLLEAGDAAAAARVAELSEDFVTQALSSVLLVVDHEALFASMHGLGRAARLADKILESSYCEELDDVLIFSRRHDGWDAAISLVTALDRDHHDLLVTILDRCAVMNAELVDDLDLLTEVLSGEESLAEDVEAEREDRRVRAGYVEPRAARAFLQGARKPPADTDPDERDSVTRAYFRRTAAFGGTDDLDPGPNLVQSLVEPVPDAPRLPSAAGAPSAGARIALGFVAALELLEREAPDTLAQRMRELAYLSNVLVAGAASPMGERIRPAQGAEAAVATTALGAALAAAETRGQAPSTGAIRDVLARVSADVLFRRAVGSLAAAGVTPTYVFDRASIADVADALGLFGAQGEDP